MSDRPGQDLPVDPDLLVLDEGAERPPLEERDGLPPLEELDRLPPHEDDGALPPLRDCVEPSERDELPPLDESPEPPPRESRSPVPLPPPSAPPSPPQSPEQERWAPLDEEALPRFEDEFEPEPVDSYVPPYVPDPPPEVPSSRRVRSHSTRSPRWFRVMFFTAVLFLVAAVGALLHRTGKLEEWFSLLYDRGPGDEVVREVVRKPDTSPDPVPEPGPDRPTPDPIPDPVPVPEPGPSDPAPLPVPAPRDPLPDPGEDINNRPLPLIVETHDNQKVTLEAGEILVELQNGNYLKGCLHTVTQEQLKLAVEGGHVTVEMSRLRKPATETDSPFRAFKSYPRTRIQLVTGEILSGRLLRSTEAEVELIFPSGRVVLRRDMVRYVDKRQASKQRPK